MKKYLFCLFFAGFRAVAGAQPAPFQVLLEPVEVAGLGGLQSYVFGQHAGKWLVIGGRLDGLHRRQPFATFDEAGHNLRLIVVDPEAGQTWSAPLDGLPAPLREQMSATNAEFHQEGDYLYIVGGYGYSPTAGDHVTFDRLTAVDVPAAIEAIVNGTGFSQHFRQLADARFAVTGGRLGKIYDTYYLVGGQRFMGRYNPMGPTHGPGFVQQYTEQVRRFRISDDGSALSVAHLPAWTDAENLHRRDYNVLPQIMPDGQEGLTAFSGVFQKTVDFPYLNCVNVDSSGHAINNAFAQHYNHYHCAALPLFDAQANEMHTVFFGGIAQFYDSLGVMVQDNNVPFVKTIARVTRRADGSMAEHKLPTEMPALLGAGAEFISLENLPAYANGVLKLNDLAADTTLVGHIFGGIASSAPNIFWTNTGSESTASSQIFRVHLLKNSVSPAHELNPQSIGTLRMSVFPNPNTGVFGVKFNLSEAMPAWLTIADSAGKIVDREALKNLRAGENIVIRQLDKISAGNAYLVTLETSTERATVKTIVQD